jgi:prolipoprotein diacylglyceryltransferase
VQSRSRLFHDSAIRFGGLHVPFYGLIVATGVFFPS